MDCKIVGSFIERLDINFDSSINISERDNIDISMHLDFHLPTTDKLGADILALFSLRLAVNQRNFAVIEETFGILVDDFQAYISFADISKDIYETCLEKMYNKVRNDYIEIGNVTGIRVFASVPSFSDFRSPPNTLA